MKKNLGVVPAVYPMPVLMVAAYDENEKVNVMNVAWGQICDSDKIILFIGEGKKTWLNINASKAFTVALADEQHMDVADFFGIASGNKIDDKFERTGYHAVKSDKVYVRFNGKDKYLLKDILNNNPTKYEITEHDLDYPGIGIIKRS